MAAESFSDRDILPVGIMGHMMHIDTEESKLLLRARELDVRALSTIHNRYYAEIYRYAYYRTGEDNVAEDIASEVFLRLLVGLHSGTPPQTTLRGWLFGVAAHLVADHFRSETRLAPPVIVDDKDSPQAEAEKNLRRSAVRQAIRNLTVEQQDVLAMRFGEGFSVEETAHMMGKSVSAVKALQFRAVEALRNLMGEEEI